MPAAALFTRLHGAAFYKALHQQAAGMLPPAAAAQTWLDVGSGPGLLARMAGAKAYAVRAVDRDTRMIAAAKAWPGAWGEISYAVSGLAEEVARGQRHDVVSASSLLVVLPDPREGLRLLAQLVKPGGRLLVIEASPQMSRIKAWAMLFSGRLGPGGALLALWAMARAGRALPDRLFTSWPGGQSRLPLLDGMANAWLLEVPGET
ncbi:MAG: methyltransferase domain-containing protein [Alphaproteobacteria bacterium]|nr:methyltransferase domain-containing protein [Alphaproteobacteria bacterium]